MTYSKKIDSISLEIEDLSGIKTRYIIYVTKCTFRRYITRIFVRKNILFLYMSQFSAPRKNKRDTGVKVLGFLSQFSAPRKSKRDTDVKVLGFLSQISFI